MLTVESLTSELGLKVSAGEQAAGECEIRWVHITELLDPTPWLSGGELLLTTGIPLENADKQRKFIRLLAGSGVAGLGFGSLVYGLSRFAGGEVALPIGIAAVGLLLIGVFEGTAGRKHA